MRAALASIVAFVAAIALPATARAGGIEMPDNGTEALGRGGAFTAKADDPTAIHHNVGGLAQQRGTRLLLDANVARSSLAFQRAGVYPGDPANPSTPWAGQRYPRAENQGGFVTLPFVAVTSDFGLSRATFAVGTFAPHSVGGRVYPLNVGGAPSPVRYDTVGGTSSVLLFHTVAGAFRITDGIDVGVAVHVVQASLGTRSISYTAIGAACADPSTENPACDARAEVTTTGWSATGSLGAVVRPASDVAIGVHVRGPVHLATEGRAQIASPSAVPVPLPDTRVAVSTKLPWIFRAGIRKTFEPRAAPRPSPQEAGDLELDLTYETWGSAMNPGPKVVLENVGPLGRQERTLLLGYEDTFSVRAGGAWNTTLLGTPLTLRGGAYFDASATASRFTRIDTDTLDKLAATAGAGVRLGSVRVDVAYASVFDVPRVVTRGALRSTEKEDAPAVNEGVFTGHTHIASLGATFELDLLLGGMQMPASGRGEQVARR